MRLIWILTWWLSAISILSAQAYFPIKVEKKWGLINADGQVVLDPVYDAIGSICIGGVLIVISVFIAWRIKALLVGRSADPEIQEAIDAILVEQESIERVFKAITIQFGPDTILAAKIKIHSGVDIDTAVDSINDLERKLRERIPKLRWCFIEPDVRD